MSRVVVVGSVNVDLVAAGGRMPRPGETVAMARFAETHGGKGGNQASAAAALGAETHLVGAVGDDDRGRAARQDLQDRGVRVEALNTAEAPTGVAIILVDDEGENSIAIVAGANATISPEEVTEALAAIEGDAVVVACLEIPIPAIMAAAATARDRGWPMILNPAPAVPLPASLIALCTVLTPNESELSLLGGADALLAAGAGAVVVTQGGAGSAIHSVRGEQHVPAYPAKVVDTTGAGDTFTAALAVALAEGNPLPEAVRFAAAAGALSTEGFGARGALPSTADVHRRLSG
ncbi:ribokinase [Paractinoplanes durhamensis]|uniref:Ribokinase n=1 Tax=Paractinoplanes durhamensis TaxID=113563 RepID=A0ABQ3YRG3_9ACTN|nr:ribokinase [Actinoplanes durhamensis]GIE00099.1 ribokinase [Actinoplanes durhamensis]